MDKCTPWTHTSVSVWGKHCPPVARPAEGAKHEKGDGQNRNLVNYREENDLEKQVRVDADGLETVGVVTE